MTQNETAAILAVVKVAYPYAFQNTTPTDSIAMVALWHRHLEAFPPAVVEAALDAHIRSEHFPPAIADIIGRIETLSVAYGAKESPDDLFARLLRAVGRSCWYAAEEYAKLPDECKEFVRTPNGLKALAEVETDTLNTVTRGQFFKRLPDIRRVLEAKSKYNPDLQRLLMSAAKGLPSHATGQGGNYGGDYGEP